MNDDPSIPRPGDEIAPRVFAQPGSLRVQFSRSAGPGGQNVNKVNTKSELWLPVRSIIGLGESALARLRAALGHRLTQNDEIHLRADAERSQEANRAAIFAQLRELILHARIEPKKRRKTKPSRGAKLRRLDSKRRRSNLKSHRRGGAEDW